MVFFSACGPRDAAYNTERYQVRDALRPAGLSGTMVGVYAVALADSPTMQCCWIGPLAKFRLRKEAAHRSLHLWIYASELTGEHQQFTVQYNGLAEPVASVVVAPGFHELTIPGPRSLLRRAGSVSVEIRCTKYFMPYRGAPKYAAILQSAYFQ